MFVAPKLHQVSLFIWHLAAANQLCALRWACWLAQNDVFFIGFFLQGRLSVGGWNKDIRIYEIGDWYHNSCALKNITMYNLHIVYINRLYKYIIIIHGHISFPKSSSCLGILLQFSIVNCYSRSSFLRPPRLYQPAQSWLTLTRYQGRRSPSPQRHAALAILPQCALFQVHLYGTLRIFLMIWQL